MVRIGQAARNGTNVDQSTFSLINDAAKKSPLSPEPFLVWGARAQVQGDVERARRNFLAAQWRDPRSIAASYFLAEYYVKFHHPTDALRQIALLSRLMPAGSAMMAPYLASFARNPSVWPQVRILFQSSPALEDAVLLALAQDARNTNTILALASPGNRRPNSSWVSPIFGTCRIRFIPQSPECLGVRKPAFTRQLSYPRSRLCRRSGSSAFQLAASILNNRFSGPGTGAITCLVLRQSGWRARKAASAAAPGNVQLSDELGRCSCTHRIADMGRSLRQGARIIGEHKCSESRPPQMDVQGPCRLRCPVDRVVRARRRHLGASRGHHRRLKAHSSYRQCAVEREV